MKEDVYAWWIRRVAFQFRLYDTLRIDHFRGFGSYLAIPYGDVNARRDCWRPGPGLKMLEFVFDSRDPVSAAYLPHNYTPHCAACPGTHDNAARHI